MVNNTAVTFAVSLNRMKITESINPNPATVETKNIATNITSGNLKEIVCPDTKHTSDSGTKPIVKFTSPEMAADKVKICGLTQIFVNIEAFFPIDVAEDIIP